MDERIDKSVFQWLGHIERMGNNIIAKRVYRGEYGKSFNRWTDSVNDCLKERGLDVG